MGGPTPPPASAPASPSDAPLASETRAALADDVIDELAGWGPADRMRAFARWHQGALSLVQLIVLSALEASGPIAMSRLAETLDISDASATGLVDRMEARGLVARADDPADRRRVLVGLTTEGAAIFHDHAERRRARLAALVGRLTDEELAGLLVGLRGLKVAIAAGAAEGGRRGEGAPAVEAEVAAAPAAEGPRGRA